VASRCLAGPSMPARSSTRHVGRINARPETVRYRAQAPGHAYKSHKKL
jgi:hypothetical protein